MEWDLDYMAQEGYEEDDDDGRAPMTPPMPMTTKKPVKVREVYASIGVEVALEPSKVKEVAETMMEVAAIELKSFGSFELAGALNMKLKKKGAVLQKKDVDGRFKKGPCGFKAKPPSHTVRVFPTQKYNKFVTQTVLDAD